MLAKLALNASKRLMKLSFLRNDGPADTLLIESLHAEEEVSRDFEYTAHVLSDNPEIALKDVQGKLIGIELTRDDGGKRWFTGYCWTFELLEYANSVATYKMTLVPWLAFLRLRKDMFIFQNKTYIEQTKEIFEDYAMAKFDLKVSKAGHRHTYCAQYDETDHNYVHRRWEEMGWHYWYEHDASGHRLILSDHSPAAEPVDGDTTIAYHHGGGNNKEDKIGIFGGQREIASGKVNLSSFDFKRPTPALVGKTSQQEQGQIAKLEVYEYRGLYGFVDAEEGKFYAERQMEQIEGDAKSFAGRGNVRQMQPGRWFTLTRDHLKQLFRGPGHKFEFLLLSVTHDIHNNLLNSDGGMGTYDNSFVCLRRKVFWRPARGHHSEEVRVPGVDTAIVVGPQGEEIYSDKYSRIKVQFHWDRMGKQDENSSPWVRVMTPWANKGFGMVAVPRIGTEVVIQYLQGNPDRPLVVGQLYNERHMPPWTLPANQTQSGVLTRSSKGGGPSNANALRFEDKKGEEEVWLHAEKDQRIEVENDESHWVGRDRKKTIDRDETVHVKRDRTETVDHNETITVHNDRKERVDHNEKISIGDNRTEDVGKDEDIHIGHSRSVHIGDHKNETVGKTKTETVALAKFLSIGGLYQTTVGGAMNTTVALAQAEEVGLSKTVVVGKTLTQTAGEQFKLTVGKSSLTLHADGRIELEGTEILISGSKKVELHGKDIDNNPA
ncbi:type VI secretion system tip protein TssI/VgrG [Massilia sp. W12]|uniref:type VI secretion system Vgr family protein n=1 Tax=Massilia sp. W12 TaxID=3126507 RepID=UPI0030D3578D